MIAAALHGATKRFGEKPALDAVSLEVRSGEVLALLGPNGAGKTTALSLLIGLRRPDSGRVELFGRDPRIPAAPRSASGSRRRRAGSRRRSAFARSSTSCARTSRTRPRRMTCLPASGSTRSSGGRPGASPGGERRRLSVATCLRRAAACALPRRADSRARRRGAAGGVAEVRAYAAGGGHRSPDDAPPRGGRGARVAGRAARAGGESSPTGSPPRSRHVPGHPGSRRRFSR